MTGATDAAPHRSSPAVIAAIRNVVLNDLREAFWLIPASMAALGVLAAVVLANLEAAGNEGAGTGWLAHAAWLYRGSASDARTLLGTVAGATIGVAGTVFSITIAALSLTAGQMGHHLLRSFTQDRGNQFTLGVFLATFSYALVLLHGIRLPDQGGLQPRLSLTVAVALALLCVATLIWFVGHMAGRINVETVVSLVGDDALAAIRRLTRAEPQPATPDDAFWADAVAVRDPRRGYLHRLDAEGLADWAARRRTALRLVVRPGDYVFPGAVIALVMPPVDGALEAIQKAAVLGRERTSAQDLRDAVRELVEVAVRALSPGINSPNTALDVLDRLGASLCEVAGRHLPTGLIVRDGRPVLVTPSTGYERLSDLMFNMIRQYGASSPVVLNRLLEVLTAVAGVETDARRVDALQRHADLVLGDADHEIFTPDDLEGVRRRHRGFVRVRRDGPAAIYGAARRP